MFDLITGQARHIPGGGGVPVLVSSALHVVAVGAVVTVPLLFMADVMPEVPTMMAFVAAAPAPPPPPPPPAPPAPKAAVAKQVPTSTPPQNQFAAPVEAPSEVTPETPGQLSEGVPGGVEGGVPGGVVGGIVGGIPTDAPPPPPPPPPPPAPAPRGPVRVGGQIQPPSLVQRVEPTYPQLAVAAHVQGTVILEAMVDPEGRVRNVKVLRSIPLLDKAAIDAVLQWRYSPVVLNGTPVPFILTVVVSFSLPEAKPRGAY